ncbi:hypothetical protein K1X84_14065 [bacterium]|nr:hypothetical protein [bacterium]
MNRSELGGRKGSIESIILRDSSPCLTLEQMINYSQGKLSNQERFIIEKHLIDCELCSEAMSRFPVDERELRLHSQSLEKRINVHTASKGSFSKKLYYYAAAATLLIGFMAALYSWQRNPYGTLVAENLKPYPNTNPLVRSEKKINFLEKALMHYELGEYSPAIADFLEAIKDNPNDLTACFYIGISYLMIDDSQLAIPQLSVVAGNETSEFYEASIWYLSLAYLEDKNAEQAKILLNELIALKGQYTAQAKKLIDDLNVKP